MFDAQQPFTLLKTFDTGPITNHVNIVVANGPGMTIFSPDGKYGYVCSSFTPETTVITVADQRSSARRGRKLG